MSINKSVMMGSSTETIENITPLLRYKNKTDKFNPSYVLQQAWANETLWKINS